MAQRSESEPEHAAALGLLICAVKSLVFSSLSRNIKWAETSAGLHALWGFSHTVLRCLSVSLWNYDF